MSERWYITANLVENYSDPVAMILSFNDVACIMEKHKHSETIHFNTCQVRNYAIVKIEEE